MTKKQALMQTRRSKGGTANQRCVTSWAGARLVSRLLQRQRLRHARHCVHYGVEEYWVTVREFGQQTTESTCEDARLRLPHPLLLLKPEVSSH